MANQIKSGRRPMRASSSDLKNSPITARNKRRLENKKAKKK